MERVTFYYGEIPRDTDFLNIGQKTMVALAALSQATLGTSVALVGLACTPGSGLTVSMAPGQIYQTEPLEATAWGAVGGGLPQDLAHNVVKQGLALDAVTVSGFTAPGGAGQSINYLVELQYTDTDTGSVVLPYYNAANPTVQFTGPGNSGGSQNTRRAGRISVQVKAGSAATTGTQVTPTPDAGWTGYQVVTVANTQTQILQSNIANYLYPPIVPITLPGIPGANQNGTWVTYNTTGTTNAYVIAPSPPIASRVIGLGWRVQFTLANTTACTLNDGLGAAALVMNNGGAMSANFITAGQISSVLWDGTRYQMVPGPAAWNNVGDGGGAALYALKFIN